MLYLSVSLLRAGHVLIDTWWNVNEPPALPPVFIFLVLIDTWWNVNYYYIYRTFERRSSFNRYMVECEFCKAYNKTSSVPGFNRYMVECECKRIFSFVIAIVCFNRYMVECEYCILDVVNSYFEVLIDTWWNVNPY